jgi:hypothetical protein
MFMRPDEHIVIMEVGRNLNPVIGPHFMLPDEYKRLVDIGLNTIYHQHAIDWQEMQPTEESPIDFSLLDEYMETIIKTGCKALIPFFHTCPQWKTPEWYGFRGPYGIPNYGAAWVGEEIDNFAKLIISRYDPKYFQLIYAIPVDGEFPAEFGPNHRDIPFPWPWLANFLIERQRLLSQQHGEIWTAYHHYTSPVWFEPVHDALQAALPDVTHYAIQFTHFVHHRRVQVERLQWARDKWGIKYFAGSEYCQGLEKHLPLAIEQGIWGFITAPLYPGPCPERLDQWQVDALDAANKALCARWS